MKQRLGIMGCGQLSQMMAEAARRQGASVSFLCLDETPVVQGLGRIYKSSEFDQFLSSCDAVTVERESLPDEMLQAARDRAGLAPGYDALVVPRGFESNPRTSTGLDGIASFRLLPLSSIKAFTLPHSDPDTNISLTFKVPF
jgi:hypothetical protein